MIKFALKYWIALFFILSAQILLNGSGVGAQTEPAGKEKTKTPPKSSASEQQTNRLISKNGFGNALWGEKFAEVKKKIVGKIKEIEEGEFIITEIGELNLKYGFFKDPDSFKAKSSYAESNEKSLPGSSKEKPKPGKGNQEENIALMTEKEKKEKKINDAAKLFYVTIRLPYVNAENIEKKLNDRLGASTGKRVESNQGIIWWDTGRNLILLWVDSVEGQGYTRKIDIIGKKVRSEIMARQKEIYSKREKEILDKLKF